MSFLSLLYHCDTYMINYIYINLFTELLYHIANDKFLIIFTDNIVKKGTSQISSIRNQHMLKDISQHWLFLGRSETRHLWRIQMNVPFMP